MSSEEQQQEVLANNPVLQHAQSGYYGGIIGKWLKTKRGPDLKWVFCRT